jgi:hypothetical protein
MRAILIDPEHRSIAEIQIDGSIDSICAALGCESFEGHPWLNGSLETGGDTIYGDAHGLFTDPPPRYFFQVDVDPPGRAATISACPGKGLVVGVDREGGGCDARISVAELTARVTFTQRVFRGAKTSSRPGRVHCGARCAHHRRCDRGLSYPQPMDGSSIIVARSRTSGRRKRRSWMRTYLVRGFCRADHKQTVCVVVDADDGLTEVGGNIVSDAFAAAQALDPAKELCFHASQNISAVVPDEIKNRVLTEAELYTHLPELDLSSRRRRRRR